MSVRLDLAGHLNPDPKDLVNLTALVLGESVQVAARAFGERREVAESFALRLCR